MNCRVTERLFEIIRLLEEEKKKPKDYGNGILLFHAEAMFLEQIYRFPEENVSGLSARLGITKGAITQISAKLVDKKLITITQREGNKKEKYFRLTPAGKQAVLGHHQFHDDANRKLCNYISTLNAEQTAVIFEFLDHLKQCAPFCDFQCSCRREEEEDKHDKPAIAQCARLDSRT